MSWHESEDQSMPMSEPVSPDLVERLRRFPNAEEDPKGVFADCHEAARALDAARQELADLKAAYGKLFTENCANLGERDEYESRAVDAAAKVADLERERDEALEVRDVIGDGIEGFRLMAEKAEASAGALRDALNDLGATAAEVKLDNTPEFMAHLRHRLDNATGALLATSEASAARDERLRREVLKEVAALIADHAEQNGLDLRSLAHRLEALVGPAKGAPE